jgi:hypothetical protein
MSPVRYWPAALLLVSGCILSPGDCAYQLRSLELAGTMTGSGLPPGTSPAAVTVSLAESKDGLSYRILSAYVTTPAAVAISLVQLRQFTPGGTKILVTFPLGNGQSGTWSSNVELPADSLPFTALSFLGRSKKLGVYVQIGVQGNLGELAGSLRLTSETGWEHPHCD